MTYTINVDKEQLNAILYTMQNETIILSQRITEMVRDDHTPYSHIEELTDRRNKLLDIIKMLEGNAHEYK